MILPSMDDSMARIFTVKKSMVSLLTNPAKARSSFPATNGATMSSFNRFISLALILVPQFRSMMFCRLIIRDVRSLTEKFGMPKE